MSQNYWIKYVINGQITTLRPQTFYIFLHDLKLLYAKPNAEIVAFGYGTPEPDTQFLGLAYLFSLPADPTAPSFADDFSEPRLLP